MDNTDTVKIFFDDARANGLTILPPDVNASEYRFVPVSRSEVRYGLGAIKGTGEQAVSMILDSRLRDGPFKDLFDFCARVDKRLVNRRTIEALVRAGAFDGLDPTRDRAELLASVGIAMEAAEQAAANAHQGGLFDIGGVAETVRPQYVKAKPWSERQRLLEEKQAVGFFLSGHPFNEVRPEVSRFVRRRLADIEPGKDSVLLAGMVVGTRTQMTRRGKMAFVMLDDGSASLEVSVFNEVYDAERAKIVVDEALIVDGKVQKDDFTGGYRVIAERLMTLAEARARFAKQLTLRMNGEVKGAGGGAAAAHKLQTLMAPYRDGQTPVVLRYRNQNAEAEMRFGESWRVRLDNRLIDDLREWLTAENVEVTYP